MIAKNRTHVLESKKILTLALSAIGHDDWNKQYVDYIETLFPETARHRKVQDQYKQALMMDWSQLEQKVSRFGEIIAEMREKNKEK